LISFHRRAPTAEQDPLSIATKYQKSRAEERLDKVVKLADQLGSLRAAASFGEGSVAVEAFR
jgi:hypothetical protein